MGKSHMRKFTKERHNSKGILYYTYSDLWGKSKVQTKGGAKNILSIIDEFLRRVWVQLLSSKNDAFSTFKEWKVVVENQMGRIIKV